MSWATFIGILSFVFSLLFIALVVLGSLIIIIAVVVGGVRAIKSIGKK